MLIYEVNLKIKKKIASEFRDWLKEHKEKMLSVKGFQEARIYVEEKKEGGDFLLWTIHYGVESQEALEAYLNEGAANMRKEGEKKFSSNFSATRRTLLPCSF